MTLQKLYSEIKILKEVNDDFCIPINIFLIVENDFDNWSNNCYLCPLDKICGSPSNIKNEKFYDDKFHKDRLLKFLVHKFPSLILEEKHEN